MSMTIQQQKEELTAISNDMRKLYESALTGALKREEVDSLANVAGKNVRALQMLWAHDVSALGVLQFNTKLEMLRERQLPSPRSKKKK
jgi:hypothetical protein